MTTNYYPYQPRVEKLQGHDYVIYKDTIFHSLGCDACKLLNPLTPKKEEWKEEWKEVLAARQADEQEQLLAILKGECVKRNGEWIYIKPTEGK